MMIQTPEEAIVPLLRRNGFSSGFSMKRLPGGANNRVFLVELDNRKIIAKHYFIHSGDQRDRLASEYSFGRFCWTNGIKLVPEPLGFDSTTHWALFEFIDGHTVTEERVTEHAVKEAAEFFNAVNHFRQTSEAASLPLASEAFFSISDHQKGIAKRFDQLTQIAGSAPIDREAQTFIKDELHDLWKEIELTLVQEAKKADFSMEAVLPSTERCISPSDFGFHNAIYELSRKFRFFDFEYAGWDDPAKMICDFFCQPKVPVRIEHFNFFVSKACSEFPEPDVIRRRARFLLPLYQFKWCCILLNEFLPVSRERRTFSSEASDFTERKSQQLAKAREWIKKISFAK
jgi:Phosphotransferase enzyme family